MNLAMHIKYFMLSPQKNLEHIVDLALIAYRDKTLRV